MLADFFHQWLDALAVRKDILSRARATVVQQRLESFYFRYHCSKAFNVWRLVSKSVQFHLFSLKESFFQRLVLVRNARKGALYNYRKALKIRAFEVLAQSLSKIEADRSELVEHSISQSQLYCRKLFYSWRNYSVMRR
ncbi:hypothetical protein RCL1_005258 [Eukaryota sp. TZLM3-RCL]